MSTERKVENGTLYLSVLGFYLLLNYIRMKVTYLLNCYRKKIEDNDEYIFFHVRIMYYEDLGKLAAKYNTKH